MMLRSQLSTGNLPFKTKDYTGCVHCCSVSKSCLIFCYPMNCSTPGFSALTVLQGCSNSCGSSRWCHPTITFSAAPFSFCPQLFPTSGSFPMNRLFQSIGQSIGTSTSASVLPINIQCWFPLGLTGLISLLSKGLSKVFSNTTFQKHQLFSTQPSLWSSFHICISLMEKL